MIAIEEDDHVRRARRTAAWARAVIGLVGIGLILAKPGLLDEEALGLAGFATILLTALVQLVRRLRWLRVEESLAGVAAILIIGLGDQQVNVLSLLWLAAVASGVMARGGRVHWIGRAVVLTALALPVIREQRLDLAYFGLIVATIGLLLTIGRLTMELNHLLRKARWDADHDGLTGLLTRTAFRGVLDRASARADAARPISLLLFDLDGFGAINKTAGHARGDELLTNFAELLNAQFGARGVIGRLGGDEFAVLLTEAGDNTGVRSLATALLEALPRVGEDGYRIGSSIGIAQAPRDGEDAEALLRAADIALRVAKRAPGGGQISSYSGGSLSGAGRESARGALQRAIGGEGLTMVVQPIVDVRSGKIHAFESLARFGADGSGSPLQWFSLADELGEREALVRGDAELNSAIAPLRERGAMMAVDDMGAGYSGLGQIMAVHPSYLKLDRSLIRGIDSDGDRAALVGALVDYAQRVGCLLVAEGMENEAELNRLIELGVPLAQGFYLARPSGPWPTLRAELPEGWQLAHASPRPAPRLPGPRRRAVAVTRR